MPDINREYEQRHLQQLQREQRELEALYYRIIDEIFNATVGITLNPIPTFFRLEDLPQLQAQVTRSMATFQQSLLVTLVNAIQAAEILSGQKNIALLEQAYGSVSDRVRALQTIEQRSFAEIASSTIRRRKLTLSDRVWNLTNQLQNEIEQALFVQMQEGKSARTMAGEMKQFLREPERLFRRVRNASGRLVLSKPARAYKPGRGVYRSSFKNALRLSIQSNNSTYRESDHNRWNKQKFVLGQEIRLSRSHPQYDMCDRLVGPYPVSYKHTGFHIQCLCYGVPILAPKSEYQAYENALLTGKEDQFQFQNRITDIHPRAKEWLQENREKMEIGKFTPLLLADNPNLVKKYLA